MPQYHTSVLVPSADETRYMVVLLIYSFNYLLVCH